MILEPISNKTNKHTWHKTRKEKREGGREGEVGLDYVAKKIISEDALRWMDV